MTSRKNQEKMFNERDTIINNISDPKAAARASRRAAVLVPFCLKEGRPAVLFTVRSQHVSTHKGQVSFPGGHTEPGESAPVAAVREAHEELGSSLGPIALIARCTTMPAVNVSLHIMSTHKLTCAQS